MFWKKKNQEKKSGFMNALDKIMMGIVIGGAIGSVIGLTVAPKKGKEMRELLKKRGGEAFDKGKKFVKDHQGGDWILSDSEMRQIPHEHIEEIEQ